MSLDQLRQTFFEEAHSLLQEMERLVLALESGNGDSDSVHALFRCAHTIKGSAGIFNFDAVVQFTHRVENVLDRLRKGEIGFDGNLAALLLDCRDHLELLVGAAATDGVLDPDVQAHDRSLLTRLDVYLVGARGTVAVRTEGGLPAQRAATSAPDGSVVSTQAWHISMQFHRDAFARGINPVSFIASLGELGTLLHVEPLLDAMPDSESMDPEACYFRFEVDLKADCERAAIESALEFLEGDCDVRIIPPRAKLEEYLQLIEAEDPGKRLRLGEILVRSGALTRKELDRALKRQAANPVESEMPSPPLGEILIGNGVVPPAVVKTALEQQKRSQDRQRSVPQVLKVPSDRIDHLIDLIGELVIASSSIGTLAARHAASAMTESASNLHGLVEEIRDVSLRMRMVPIGDTFTRFQRAVRDIASGIGKEIELVISGAETELDKSMVELIADPLMHLVRNSADHGIEMPAVREAAGKPTRGRLQLNAYHDSGSVVIEVADDGGGLNRERIRAKAVEKGLIAADAVLEDSEIDRLIFAPGFSTADAVTKLSGRGVGMDVVKQNIEALRGTIDIESRPGEGTCMRLRLPLTLAIIDGFLVELAGARYVVPLDVVIECLDLGAEERAETHQRGFINLRGSALPVIDLRALFGLRGSSPARENILVVNYGGLRAGLIVDRLLGQLQVVIKPLPGIFRQVRGIGGSTILGDGCVAPILDVPGLLQRAMVARRSSTGRHAHDQSASLQMPAPAF